MNPTFVVIEIGATAFFVLAAWLALRRGRLPFLELISAAAFGLLLEEGDQLIFGTYHYSPDFALAVDRAPLVIGLTWALIIAGAMRITDALGVRRRFAPFVDALLALMLDLAFDAIAIRMGLWTWRGMTIDQGWFGVPAGNFYAWLFVTLGFSVLTRWLRAAAPARPRLEWLQLAVPLPAFALLLVALVPFTVLKPLVDPSPGGGWILFVAALAGFIVVGVLGIVDPRHGPDRHAGDAMLDLRLAFATRVAIHLVFLTACLALGLLSSAPVVVGAAVVLFALEVPLAILSHRRHGTAQRHRPPADGATVVA